MGTFTVACSVQNPADRKRTATVTGVIVDTGSEYSWLSARILNRIRIPREKDITFVMANGEHITRSIGYAIIRVDGYVTIDEVVFAEPGDLLLLGARTLEGNELEDRPAREAPRHGGADPCRNTEAGPPRYGTEHEERAARTHAAPAPSPIGSA